MHPALIMNMFDYLLEEVECDEEYVVAPSVEKFVPNKRQESVPLRDDIRDTANTAALLQLMNGEAPNVSPVDSDKALNIFESGREPTTYEKTLPGVMLKLEALLTQYDHDVIKDANQIRRYVTNRLVEETDDVDPKIRMKAYELLGKISDVGLFTEKKEITINHQSDEDLEALLRSKLDTLLDGEYDVEDVDVEDDVPENLAHE